MKPASPVYEPSEDRWGVKEVVFAKNQPQYKPLPALLFTDGLVVTRWELSFWERVKVALTGSIFVSVLTFNGALQPVKLSTNIEDAI